MSADAEGDTFEDEAKGWDVDEMLAVNKEKASCRVSMGWLLDGMAINLGLSLTGTV